MQSNDLTMKELNNGKIFYDCDNNIVQFIKHPEIKHSNYEGTIELYHEISKMNGNRLPILLNFEGLEKMSMDCRLFLMNRIFDVSDKVAVVIDKGSTLMHQFNTVNHLNFKSKEIAIYFSNEDAINWLCN